MKLNSPPLLALQAAAVLALGLLLPRVFPDRVPDLVMGLLFGLGIGLALAALLRWRLPAPCDTAPAALRRRYTREIVLAMAAYAATLVLSMTLLRRMELDLPVRALLALLPLPPIAYVLRAMVRYIRDVDEMQQRIELEAVSIGTALVCLLYMAGGFLQAAKVIDIPGASAMIWVFPFICVAYGVAKALVIRRYQ